MKRHFNKRLFCLLAILLCLTVITAHQALSAAVNGTGATLLRSLGLTDLSAPVPASQSSFAVHFIDVGQADAALILCDGHAMLIDGGNAADSSRIYTYLKSHGVDYLDYIVCTHPHEDHVGGLSGALNYAKTGAALCSVTSYESKSFHSFVSYLSRQGKSLSIPNAGDTFQLGGASVQVIGPIRSSEEINNMSIVLRVVYGDTSFVFTGDAEREEEQDILAAGYPLSATVLKVGHHGGSDSTTDPFLREIAPAYAVISVGKGNTYGHPTENTLSRLRDAGTKVYRTDMQGDIICVSDGQRVQFAVSRNEDADTLGNAGTTQETATGQSNGNNSQPGTIHSYILNTNTRVFHNPDCKSTTKMSEKNKTSLEGTREEAIALGYSPCAICRP